MFSPGVPDDYRDGIYVRRYFGEVARISFYFGLGMELLTVSVAVVAVASGSKV